MVSRFTYPSRVWKVNACWLSASNVAIWLCFVENCSFTQFLMKSLFREQFQSNHRICLALIYLSPFTAYFLLLRNIGNVLTRQIKCDSHKLILSTFLSTGQWSRALEYSFWEYGLRRSLLGWSWCLQSCHNKILDLTKTFLVFNS